MPARPGSTWTSSWDHLASAYEARAAVEPDARDLVPLAREAAARLAAAGKRAQAERDTPTAVALMRRAAALLPPDAPESVALAPYLGLALSWFGDREEAVRVLDEAERAAGGDEVAVARITVIRDGIRVWRRDLEDPEGVVRHVERALEVLSAVGDDEGLAWTYMLAYHASYRRPGSEVRTPLGSSEVLRLAAAHARAAGSRAMEGVATSWLCVEMRRGTWSAEDVEAEVGRVLADPPTQFARGSALGALGTLRAMQGSFDEGRALVAESHALLESLGAPPTVAADLIAVADVEIIAGENAVAEQILRDSLARLDGFGDEYSAVNAAWRLAQVLVRLGRLDEAEAALERATEIEVSEFVHVHVWRDVLAATIAARRGDADTTRELLATADRTLAVMFDGGMSADVFLQAAQACALIGDVDGAVERLGRAAAMARRVGYVVTEREAEAQLAAFGASAGPSAR